MAALNNPAIPDSGGNGFMQGVLSKRQVAQQEYDIVCC